MNEDYKDNDVSYTPLTFPIPANTVSVLLSNVF
jgi:hypothetical protein